MRRMDGGPFWWWAVSVRGPWGHNIERINKVIIMYLSEDEDACEDEDGSDSEARGVAEQVQVKQGVLEA